MARVPLIVAMLGLVLLGAPGLAHAQPSGEEARTEQARELFREALEHADAEDWDRAAHRLERALELRDAATIRYNLGIAYSHLGRLLEAARILEDAIEAEDADDVVRSGATEQLEAVRARIGRLRVDIEGPRGEAVVTVDGQPWLDLGEYAPADPGIRVVRLLVGTDVLQEENADVPEGGRAEVRLRVPQIFAEATDEAARNEGGGDDGVIWAVVLTTVAVLAAGGVVAGVLLYDELGPQASTGDFMPGVLTVGP